jgi:hypothetical protein
MTARRSIALGAATVLAMLAGVLLSLARPAGASAARLHVTVTLRPRDPRMLAATAAAVSTPGSPAYGHYLRPGAFGARFGARPAQIARIRAALRARGLRPGPPSAGGLSIPLSATRSALAAAGTRLQDALPPASRAVVEAVVGQSTGLAGHPLAVRPPRGPATHRSRTIAPGPHAAPTHPATTRRPHATGPVPCPAETAAAAADHAFTADQIAATYGFGPLYAAGQAGAGTTVAVYELEPDDPADISAFQACNGTHARVSYVHVDGGAGAGAGSDEAAFDIENVIGFAPDARVLVYQAPNSDSGLPGSGPYDLFSAIVNQDRAQVVSVSWGQCEAQLGVRAAEAEHALFEQAAVEGQTIVAAAGDDGAEDCDTGGARSSLAPAVDDPASQPDVLGVGGTTLSRAGSAPVQSVWNSGAGTGEIAVGAGGGGVSSLWPMAPAQFDTPARLHVRRPAAAGTACGRTRGFCREVPDVAADADPTTGYEIYWNGADTVPEPSGWQALGGTSGAAPLWAALIAVADASPACAGAPLGDVDPALYRAASAHPTRDLDDVTAGDNDFTGTDSGRWPAGPGYDLATGLGTPLAAPLAADLCADTVRLRATADQSSALHAAVGLRLHGDDVRGARLTYAAASLPPGIHIDPRTGRLHGRPRRPGRYSVRAEVHDGRGSRASRVFHWTIGGVPRLTAARVAGGRLRLRVAAGRHVPSLRGLRVRLPAGLQARGRRRIAVRARGRAQVRVHGTVVSVQLPHPARAVTVVIAVRGRTAAPRVRVGVRAGSTGTSALSRPLTEGGR